jgi:TRAP-type C4-dicarboxylate transport system permease small subunit
VWVSYLGASLALASGSHFQVDVFVAMLNPQLQKTINIAGNVAVIAFSIFTINKGYFLFQNTATQSMAMLPFSLRWEYLCIPVTAMGMTVHSLTRIWREFCTKTSISAKLQDVGDRT